ncbi:gliding motility lipoprotein GldH [Gaetbulibacter jejuensis]|uniref:Gliding motility lipoprotein GldH n=2 Tax=Gaetbulibacter jejuensis TaxID=584607 RepID=A0ABN1JEB1_9FLAO
MSILCYSCDSNLVFDEYQTVPNQWNKDSVVSFNVTPPDSSNTYNLFLNLRNNNSYKYSNLFLIVEMNYPNGKVQKDTLEYDMTAPDGTFLGKGFTDVKENKLWYKGYEKPFVFNEVGEYTVKIQQAMRENGKVDGVENLEGITEVGFRIEHSNTN